MAAGLLSGTMLGAVAVSMTQCGFSQLPPPSSSARCVLTTQAVDSTSYTQPSAHRQRQAQA